MTQDVLTLPPSIIHPPPTYQSADTDRQRFVDNFLINCIYDCQSNEQHIVRFCFSETGTNMLYL